MFVVVKLMVMVTGELVGDVKGRGQGGVVR